MKLSIDSQGEGICHMSLSGRISQNAASRELDQFHELLGEAHFNQHILLSLQDTDHIDSSGIGWLLAADKRIRQAGGKLVIHSVPIDVQHVLGLMKLDRVLRIAKDKQHATSLALGEP